MLILQYLHHLLESNTGVDYYYIDAHISQWIETRVALSKHCWVLYIVYNTHLDSHQQTDIPMKNYCKFSNIAGKLLWSMGNSFLILEEIASQWNH